MLMGLNSSARREDQRIEHCATYGQKEGRRGRERDVDLTSSANTTTTRRRGAGGCAASIARSLLRYARLVTEGRKGFNRRTDTDGRNKDLFLWMLQSLDFVFSLRKKKLERVSPRLPESARDRRLQTDTHTSCCQVETI